MNKEVRYEVYQESDAPKVVELLRKNKFYFSKFDDDLTVEKFLELQKRRGLICAIVAKKGDEIIAHVAAYHNGGQRIAAKNQVVISSLLIDESYRIVLRSVINLYTSIAREIIKMGYTEILAEVAHDNRASLYALRKCNFVLFDDSIDNYGNYVLHNYIPGIVMFTQSDKEISLKSLSRYISVIDKKNLIQKEEIVYGNYIDHIYNSPYGKMKLLININNGLVAGVELFDKLNIYPATEKGTYYEIKGISNEAQLLEITSIYKDNKISKESLIVEGNKIKKIDINELKELKIKVSDIGLNLNFRVKDALIEKFEEVCESDLDEAILNEEIGFLEYRKKDKVKIKEMWPFITDPFIDGMVIPNKEKGLMVTEKDDKHIAVKETRKDCEIVRVYKKEDGFISINTKVNLEDAAEMYPVFHFGLDDIKFKCYVETSLGITEKKFDPMDTYRATEELLYVDFNNEDYSKEYFDKIIVKYKDIKYEITTERKAKCFIHFNYIGIVYDNYIYKNKKNIDFGDITIKKN